MPLAPGTRLDRYEILAPLGAGGMGEVYRARDTVLGREVAIKLLPDAFARDDERAARFRREARSLAALNHPNIAAIYDVDESKTCRFLALELVPGATLAERIAAGPLPVAEVLKLGRQVAEALEAAHAKGILHRDLKPANIKITPEGTAKVLDFGLAKSLADPDPGSPTVTDEGTLRGAVLGTVAYMSPEQARGKPLDRRTDVWALGCVLYEALTRRRAFPGETVSDTIAAVLEREPDWNALPAATPAPLRRALRRALAKDAARRLHDVADLRLDLEEAAAAPPESTPPPSSRMPLFAWILASALAAGLLGVLAGARLWRPAEHSAQAPSVRAALPLPAGWSLAQSDASSVAMSRDGTRIAYAAVSRETTRLFVRDLDHAEALELAGTEGASGPFFSPDGRWVGFLAQGKLQKVSIEGGAPAPLCEMNAFGNLFGATWSDDGIFFGKEFAGGIVRVPASGGQAESVTFPDPQQREMSHYFPEVLPGGNLMYTVKRTDIESFDDAAIAVRVPATGVQKTIVQGGTHARFLPVGGDSGYLVYARARTLYAVPFDVSRLETSGGPSKIADGVMTNPHNGVVQFGMSSGGPLVYASAPPEGEPRLVWVDRSGAVQPFPLQFPPLFHQLSRDGKRIVMEKDVANHDVWTYDLDRGTLARLTHNGDSHYPLWSPDGSQIAFRSGRPLDLYIVPADASRRSEPLLKSEHDKMPEAWSPDGRWLAYAEADPANQFDLWVLPLDGDRKPRLFLRTPYREYGAAFSPDSRWLAYVSNESRRDEVYVQPFPGPGGRWQVSSDGGMEPMWAANGKELFYRAGRKMMAVDVETQPTFRAGRPRALFEGVFKGPARHPLYAVAPDGRRFLMIQAETPRPVTQLELVFGSREELLRRARQLR